MTTIGGGALTQQLYQKLFDRLDTDTDQTLSLDELKAADSDRSGDAFATMLRGLDADQDGKIGRAEIAAAPAVGALASSSGSEAVASLFARADIDGDGKLSDDEMEAEKALRRAETLDNGFLSGPVFLARDADGDGLRSQDEMVAAMPQRLPASALRVDVEPAQWSQIRSGPDGETVAAPPARTDEDRQKLLDQFAADQAERESGPAGTITYLAREIGDLRDKAAADFAASPMTQTLSSRLLAQILGGLAA
jgi:hypothetical protein